MFGDPQDCDRRRVKECEILATDQVILQDAKLDDHTILVKRDNILSCTGSTPPNLRLQESVGLLALYGFENREV